MKELMDIFGLGILCESKEEMKTVLTLLYDEVKQRNGNIFDAQDSETYAGMFLDSCKGYPVLQLTQTGIYQGESATEFINFKQFMIKYNSRFGESPLRSIYD